MAGTSTGGGAGSTGWAAGSTGGGSTGGDFGFAADAVRLNQRIDEAAGRDELERRIRELKARLRQLEEQQGD